jgi:hypothetical protein
VIFLFFGVFIMVIANLVVFGNERNQYGMPVPYRSYMISGIPWQEKESSIATVVGFSADIPMPNSPNLLTLEGGEAHAVKEMVDRLINLPENFGLNSLLDSTEK